MTKIHDIFFAKSTPCYRKIPKNGTGKTGKFFTRSLDIRLRNAMVIAVAPLAKATGFKPHGGQGYFHFVILARLAFFTALVSPDSRNLRT